MSKEAYIREYDKSEEASRMADQKVAKYTVCLRCNRSVQLDENGKMRMHGVYVLGSKRGFHPCKGVLR